MTNELLLTAWDPVLEHGILMLQLDVREFIKEEDALEGFEATGPTDLELAQSVCIMVL